MSLIREGSVSKDVRLFGDFGVVTSIAPCGPERSDEEVDGRESSGCFCGLTAPAGCDDISSPLPSPPSVWLEGDEGDAFDSGVGAGLVLSVRNWMLETACLSTVGTLNTGLVARDEELNERELRGLGREVAMADKGVRGFSTVVPADVSLLILFCGKDRGDGL